MVDLEFYNPDAGEPVIRLKVSRLSVPHIMKWYGSHYAGDDYAVMIEGAVVEQDINGEFIPFTIEATHTAHPIDDKGT